MSVSSVIISYQRNGRSERESDKTCANEGEGDDVKSEDAIAVVTMNVVSFAVEHIGPDSKRRNWNSPVVAGIHPVGSRQTTRCNL